MNAPADTLAAQDGPTTTTRDIAAVLRRAESVLCLSAEPRLAGQVAAIRRGTCSLVSAVQREREATTPSAIQTARMDAIDALAELARLPA